MKLSILLAGSILTSAIVGNAYAQTCGAQPSCSSLGYTYTGSTSDCVNTPMKCPFNTSYFNCVKKTDVYNGIAPDYYTGKQLRTDGTSYAVGSGELSSYKCAWILFRSENTNSQDQASTWWINSATVGQQRGLAGKWADYNSAMFWVVSGDQFSLDGHATNDYLYIYPCRGN